MLVKPDCCVVPLSVGSRDHVVFGFDNCEVVDMSNGEDKLLKVMPIVSCAFNEHCIDRSLLLCDQRDDGIVENE